MDKIKEIDYFRRLATIFVIIIHLTSSYLTYPKESITYFLFGSLNCALTFAVPAFLFISALIMTYQIKNTQNIKWIKFISKRIFKVLSALILWSIIYVFYWGNLKNLTLKSIIGYLTLGTASYHLYFIPLIIQLYIIFPFIWFITKKTSKIKLNTLLSFLLCIIIGAGIQYSFTTIFRLTIFKTFTHFSTIIFSYTLPITIGVWLGFNYIKVKNFFNKFLISFLIILTILCGYYYVNFEFINYTYRATLLFSPFYWSVVIITMLYLLRYIKKSTFLSKISKYSFIIYLSHPLILDIVNKELKPFSVTSSSFINYSIDVVIKLIIVLTIAYLLSFIWYKLKNILNKKRCCKKT